MHEAAQAREEPIVAEVVEARLVPRRGEERLGLERQHRRHVRHRRPQIGDLRWKRGVREVVDANGGGTVGAHEVGAFGVYQIGDVHARSWIDLATAASQHEARPGGTVDGFSQSIPDALQT